MAWDKAEEFCRTKGAHLASVTSKATNDYIEAELNQRDHHIFIGGSDKESEGTWKWSDGSTWEFTNWGTIQGQEQPSNTTGQDCLEYHSSKWKWNDVRCTYRGNFLCSIKLCSGESQQLIFFTKIFSGAGSSTVLPTLPETETGIEAFLYVYLRKLELITEHFRHNIYRTNHRDCLNCGCHGPVWPDIHVQDKMRVPVVLHMQEELGSGGSLCRLHIYNLSGKMQVPVVLQMQEEQKRGKGGRESNLRRILLH